MRTFSDIMGGRSLCLPMAVMGLLIASLASGGDVDPLGIAAAYGVLLLAVASAARPFRHGMGGGILPARGGSRIACAKPGKRPEEPDEASPAKGGDDATDGPGAPRGRRRLGWLGDTLIIFFAALACSTLFRLLVVDVFVVPTESMYPTIMPADRLFGEKLTYRVSDPQPGDVVTFLDPLASERADALTYVKRCVAVGGDEVDLRDGAVYVNGVPLEEPYVHGQPSLELSSQADGVSISYPFVVPDGYIWVMGDNRTNSSDSRYFGPVPVDRVTSRGVVVFWPPSHARSL